MEQMQHISESQLGQPPQVHRLRQVNSIIIGKTMHNQSIKKEEVPMQDSELRLSGINFMDDSQELQLLNPNHRKESKQEKQSLEGTINLSGIGEVPSIIVKKFTHKEPLEVQKPEQLELTNGKMVSDDICRSPGRKGAVARKNSVQVATNDPSNELFDRYRIVLASVRIMSFLEYNFKYVLPSRRADSMDLLLNCYIILLRALFRMEEIEKQRRTKQLSPSNEEETGLVGEGIAFLKELFHSLVKIREQLTEAIVEVSEDLELEGFARRILAHPDKIYVIFKADEVEKVYRKLVKEAYQKFYKNLKEKRPVPTRDVRLCLALLLCSEHERIFHKDKIERHFSTFFKHTERIRKILRGQELEAYISKAPWEHILNHHRDLRRDLGIVSKPSKS